MIRMKKFCSFLLFGAIAGSLLACKVSDDAAAASQQMVSTATTLRTYYKALDASVGATISLYELDGAISRIPYADSDRVLPEATRSELQKRGELADSLAKLASAMSTLSNLKAASDVEASATQLGNELIAVRALPGGSPVPDVLEKAGNVLLQMAQQHDEKKAARAMDDTAKAVSDLFEKEKPVYDSLARTHDRQATQIAQDLITSNAVDPTPMLSPALKPYDLNPLPITPILHEELKALLLARLQRSTDDATHREAAASAAMLASLREMSSRIHLLATEKAMRLRGNPLSLNLVESWAQSRFASLV